MSAKGQWLWDGYVYGHSIVDGWYLPTDWSDQPIPPPCMPYNAPHCDICFFTINRQSTLAWQWADWHPQLSSPQRATKQAHLGQAEPPASMSPELLYLWDYNDQLWRHNAQGRHQLVIQHLKQRVSVMHNAYEKLGHKGFYSMLCTSATVRHSSLMFPHCMAWVACAFVAALNWLEQCFGIQHIQILAYNSWANSIVERKHHTIQKSIVKACEGTILKWPSVVPYMFWADQATTHKSTGHSPFYIAQGIEPVLPFNITLSTFLVPNVTNKLTTVDLIATCAWQLKRCEDNLTVIHSNILKSHFESIHQFEHQLENTIHDYDFALISRPYCNCTPHVWIYSTVLYISQWMNLDFQLTLCYAL